MTRTSPQLALIGLGLVGESVAVRLVAAGYAVAGWDRAEDRRRLMGARGIAVAASAAAAVRSAPFVLLALPDTPALDAVLHEILPALKRGVVVIDLGTDDPAVVSDHAAMLARRGIALVDAPLSGSSEQIRAGAAVAVVGGDKTAWDAAARIVAAIAPQAFHLGPSGSGSRAKLATNLLLGLNRAALAESLVFAQALGLDPARFLDVVRASPAYSRAVDAKGAKMLASDYSPQSRIRQHRKDLALMLEAATAAHCALPLTRTHAALLDAAIETGDGDLDNAAIIETIRRWPVTPAAPNQES